MSRTVEDIPMFWMLRPLGENEIDKKTGEKIHDSNDIVVWKRSTINRGMEDPHQHPENGTELTYSGLKFFVYPSW